MDGFNYVDIFATKGLEYLLVIAMLLVFLPFWIGLRAPARAIAGAVKRIVPALQGWFGVPEGFFFHQGHAWARPAEGDLVTVGLDDFAGKLVGPLSGVQVPEVGSELVQGERGFAIAAGAESFPLLSPVDGEVVEVNGGILNAPGRIVEDPYGPESWLVKVRVPGRAANLKNLLSGSTARTWMDEVQGRLLARSGSLGAVYADGGLPVNGMARSLDPEKWDEIVKEFLLAS